MPKSEAIGGQRFINGVRQYRPTSGKNRFQHDYASRFVLWPATGNQQQEIESRQCNRNNARAAATFPVGSGMAENGSRFREYLISVERERANQYRTPMLGGGQRSRDDSKTRQCPALRRPVPCLHRPSLGAPDDCPHHRGNDMMAAAESRRCATTRRLSNQSQKMSFFCR